MKINATELFTYYGQALYEQAMDFIESSAESRLTENPNEAWAFGQLPMTADLLRARKQDFFIDKSIMKLNSKEYCDALIEALDHAGLKLQDTQVGFDTIAAIMARGAMMSPLEAIEVDELLPAITKECHNPTIAGVQPNPNDKVAFIGLPKQDSCIYLITAEIVPEPLGFDQCSPSGYVVECSAWSYNSDVPDAEWSCCDAYIVPYAHNAYEGIYLSNPRPLDLLNTGVKGLRCDYDLTVDVLCNDNPEQIIDLVDSLDVADEIYQEVVDKLPYPLRDVYENGYEQEELAEQSSGLADIIQLYDSNAEQVNHSQRNLDKRLPVIDSDGCL